MRPWHCDCSIASHLDLQSSSSCRQWSAELRHAAAGTQHNSYTRYRVRWRAVVYATLHSYTTCRTCCVTQSSTVIQRTLKKVAYFCPALFGGDFSDVLLCCVSRPASPKECLLSTALAPMSTTFSSLRILRVGSVPFQLPHVMASTSRLASRRQLVVGSRMRSSCNRGWSQNLSSLRLREFLSAHASMCSSLLSIINA